MDVMIRIYVDDFLMAGSKAQFYGIETLGIFPGKMIPSEELHTNVTITTK